MKDNVTPKSDKAIKRTNNIVRDDFKSVIGWIVSGLFFGLAFSSIWLSVGCFIVAFIVYLFKDSEKKEVI